MPQSIIKKIVVEQLFGKFSYNIPEEGELESPAILYGDNGVGKSTVLALAFHLLSSANDKGHRTAIGKVPFKSFSVHLTNGIVVSAKRAEINSEVTEHTISDNGKLIAEWVHSKGGSEHLIGIDADEMVVRYLDDARTITAAERVYLRKLNTPKPRKKDGVLRGNHLFLRRLDQVAPKIFYLNADRKLDSDALSDSAEGFDFRRVLSSRDAKNPTDILRASRSISLSQALENAARWVNRRAVSDANRGSENTHSAYETILDQIAIGYQNNSESLQLDSIRSLGDLIDRIEQDTKSFSKYELAAELGMEKFRTALQSGNETSSAISARLIEPYIRGLITRIDAIRPLYNVVDSFVETINSFLSGKHLLFSLSRGFYIVDFKGSPLGPSELSSGEQQLLLIFSHVLAARENPSVFIIDEPEISLNIKWQRKIVGSLLAIAEGSTIQFVFASHSLELIAQHSDAVVKIGR